MFNIAYEAVTLPIKQIAYDYIEARYPSTKRENDPVEMIQKRIKEEGVANTLNEIAKAMVVSCAVAPILEELIFRGAIQCGATSLLGSEDLGAITSAALFALTHYTNNKNPLDIGFQLADCYFLYNPARASGGLLASMAVHSFHNLSCFLPIVLKGLRQKEEG